MHWFVSLRIRCFSIILSFDHFIQFCLQCICVARGQTANEADGTDCNGKLFRCVDPGSYIRCDVDPEDSSHTSVGNSDTVICADDTICDDNAESPCSSNQTASEETPSEPQTEPEQVATETPSEPSNNPDDGNDEGEVNTPSGEDGEESTSENSDPNEGETATSDNSNGDNGSGESTEPSDSNGGETSTPSENDSTSESTTASDETNSPTSPDEPPATPETTETPEFTCPAVGRFPHPTDCQKYNFCWDLEHPYVTFTCKGKHVYDARLGRCANDWSACPNAPTCVANHQVLADPADNRFYFLCKNIGSLLWPQFVIHKKECDKHSTFDPDLLVCVLNEIDGGEGNDSSESEEHHQKVKFECTEAGIFPDLTDETKYFECIMKNVAKGKLKTHHRSCPKHHVFSLQDMQCIPVVVGEIVDE